MLSRLLSLSLAENWQPYVAYDNDIKFSLNFAVGLYSQEAIANWSWKILIIYIIFVSKINPLIFIWYHVFKNSISFILSEITRNQIWYSYKNRFNLQYKISYFRNYLGRSKLLPFKRISVVWIYDWPIAKKLVIFRMKTRHEM